MTKYEQGTIAGDDAYRKPRIDLVRDRRTNQLQHIESSQAFHHDGGRDMGRAHKEPITGDQADIAALGSQGSAAEDAAAARSCRVPNAMGKRVRSFDVLCRLDRQIRSTKAGSR